MSTSRPAVGVTSFRDRNRDKPRRHRFGLLFLLSLGAGGVAGICAFALIWLPTLFGAFHAGATQPQIEASTLFPSPAPVQNTINIYDPPAYSRPASHVDAGDAGGVDN
ncbi:MAG TPA: hypothetical protein VEW68_10600 [Patescibacteria group bacterium]|nr:hypothetical protein [Patescibacteria group bacterium]